MNMFLEAAKIALAGLMIVGDICGLSDPNSYVLELAQKAGIENPYFLNSIVTENNGNTTGLQHDIVLPNSLIYRKDDFSNPILNNTSVIVLDNTTGSVLYADNVDEKVAMASTTKLMTAIVALENLKKDDIVVVNEQDTLVEPMKMYLVPGEEISVDSLMQALLIPSYNDAALVLARASGNGDIDSFVQKMNDKAATLGLKNTHFANPHGLDAENHYTTARELALIARYALQNEYIKNIVGTRQTEVYSEDGTAYMLKNTNELLDSYLDIKGVKTGFTDNAGQVLVTLAADQSGNEILTVVMNSSDRFQETKGLIEWTFRTYEWE